MRVHCSAASPAVRKCVAVAPHRGRTLERVASNPHASPDHLLAANPLSKVPSPATDDGIALNDSPINTECLDHIGEGRKLYPAPGPARWKALEAGEPAGPLDIGRLGGAAWGGGLEGRLGVECALGGLDFRDGAARMNPADPALDARVVIEALGISEAGRGMERLVPKGCRQAAEPLGRWALVAAP